MQESREGHIPQITSELEAPRNGKPSRQPDSTNNKLSLTRDQLGMFFYRTLDRLLNTGEDVEEIRLHLRQEAENFFKKRA